MLRCPFGFQTKKRDTNLWVYIARRVTDSEPSSEPAIYAQRVRESPPPFEVTDCRSSGLKTILNFELTTKTTQTTFTLLVEKFSFCYLHTICYYILPWRGLRAFSPLGIYCSCPEGATTPAPRHILLLPLRGNEHQQRGISFLRSPFGARFFV